MKLPHKKNIIYIFIGLIVLVLFLIQAYLVYDVSFLKKEVKNISVNLNKNKLNWERQNSDQVAKRINKYGASVMIIGGVGSMVTKKEAWNLEDQEYLVPAEDWIPTYLNKTAEMIRVFCRDEYRLTECSGGEIDKLTEKMIDCVGYIDNKIQNVIGITCEKIK